MGYFKFNTIPFLSLSLGLMLMITSCSPNNVKEDNLIKPFFDKQGVTGSFGIYDNGTGNFIIYNLKRYRDTAFLPASTFKVVNSLIGIETGKITNEKMVIPWDGIVRTFPNGDTAKDWNKDLTMEEAFKVSALPYYQEVARRIGKDTMQHWLDSLKYGNHQVGNEIDRFWVNNTLKITADEQLGLIKKLYFGQLPFQKRTQEIVKRVMLQESNANYQLSYKTGTGFLANGKCIGWMVGWIVENKHPFFFVLNLEAAADAPMKDIQKEILTGILKQQGFLEGKR
jgi:beta-lactamase class D